MSASCIYESLVDNLRELRNVHLHANTSLLPLQKLLSFQSKDVSEVSKFTVDNLQYRINPCLHEAERQTVESLLYIPPSKLYYVYS